MSDARPYDQDALDGPPPEPQPRDGLGRFAGENSDPWGRGQPWVDADDLI